MIAEKWKKAIFYPLTLWLLFTIIAFLFGFSAWPDITQMVLLSASFPFFIAFAMGLWIGAESKNEFSFYVALQNAFIVSFVVGIIDVLLTIILINNSPTFVVYSTTLYQAKLAVPMPIIDLVVSTWLGGIFVCLPASAASYTFLVKSQRKER
jgi:hypothetical protein